jgi:hypothetical protein
LGNCLHGPLGLLLEIGTDLYFDYKGCLGMARLPFTIGGKSFTSSYTSVIETIRACLRVALSGLVVRLRQVRGEHFLQRLALITQRLYLS